MISKFMEALFGGSTQRLPRGEPYAHDPFEILRPQVTNQQKYVNMTDINLSPLKPRPVRSSVSEDATGRPPMWDLIELLFFAYRDFVSDPDDVLAKLGFGRAHHRVLHFVNRNPGIKVADLLDILRITKQSLGRVLKQLVDEDYIVQKEGERDRRQRLLFATDKGQALAMRLAQLQTDRIARALSDLGPGAHEEARKFLAAMIDPDGRSEAMKLVEHAIPARPQGR